MGNKADDIFQLFNLSEDEAKVDCRRDIRESLRETLEHNIQASEI